jgi:hypothetical protein
MTTKRRKWLLALAGVMVLIALTAWLTREREPSYKGVSYSDWLGRYWLELHGNYDEPRPHTEAYLALRAIGTNALPLLLNWVAHAEPERRAWLDSVVQRLPAPISESNWAEHLVQPDGPPSFCTLGFLLLGADAEGAVPELERLMHAPDAPSGGMYAALGLAYIGPPGLPPLLQAASDPHARCRYSAVVSLGELDTNATSALPLLTNLLTDADADIRIAATNVLKCIAPSPD